MQSHMILWNAAFLASPAPWFGAHDRAARSSSPAIRPAALRFRRARAADLGELRAMHRISFRAFGSADYSAAELDGFFADVETADPLLIEDGTYAVAESGGRIAASGGWTLRRPDYEAKLGGGAPSGRVATIRAIFTHPDFARQGLARRIMELAETEAVLIGGAERLELCATLSAIGFYESLGYTAVAPAVLPLGNGAMFRSVRMTKPVPGAADGREAA